MKKQTFKSLVELDKITIEHDGQIFVAKMISFVYSREQDEHCVEYEGYHPVEECYIRIKSREGK